MLISVKKKIVFNILELLMILILMGIYGYKIWEQKRHYYVKYVLKTEKCKIESIIPFGFETKNGKLSVSYQTYNNKTGTVLIEPNGFKVSEKKVFLK